MNNEVTLRELQEACCKAFLENVQDMDDVLQSYEIAVIDGKSPIVTDEQINQKRRTFGFYWNEKVCVHSLSGRYEDPERWNMVEFHGIYMPEYYQIPPEYGGIALNPSN